jgi:hypothetical protein
MLPNIAVIGMGTGEPSADLHVLVESWHLST